MSAVEEIQAAIDKLTALVERASTPGPWFLAYEGATHPRVWGNADNHGEMADHVATMARFAGDADLIVTLHRTIDAQMAILEDLLAEAMEGDAILGGALQADDFIGSSSAAMMALARAINGVTS